MAINCTGKALNFLSLLAFQCYSLLICNGGGIRLPPEISSHVSHSTVL